MQYFKFMFLSYQNLPRIATVRASVGHVNDFYVLHQNNVYGACGGSVGVASLVI